MSELREVDITTLKERYHLRAFVETGCNHGNGLRYAEQCGFSQRYSCDTNPDFVRECASLGEVSHSESQSFLQATVEALAHVPTLFWLDAHYASDYGAEGPWFPLLDELRILATKAGIERDVILCDDMCVLPERQHYVYQYVLTSHGMHLTLAELQAALPLPWALLPASDGNEILAFTPA